MSTGGGSGATGFGAGQRAALIDFLQTSHVTVRESTAEEVAAKLEPWLADYRRQMAEEIAQRFEAEVEAQRPRSFGQRLLMHMGSPDSPRIQYARHMMAAARIARKHAAYTQDQP